MAINIKATRSKGSKDYPEWQSNLARQFGDQFPSLEEARKLTRRIRHAAMSRQVEAMQSEYPVDDTRGLFENLGNAIVHLMVLPGQHGRVHLELMEHDTTYAELMKYYGEEELY